jgi:hypothetical protein
VAHWKIDGSTIVYLAEFLSAGHPNGKLSILDSATGLSGTDHVTGEGWSEHDTTTDVSIGHTRIQFCCLLPEKVSATEVYQKVI